MTLLSVVRCFTAASTTVPVFIFINACYGRSCTAGTAAAAAVVVVVVVGLIVYSVLCAASS